MCRGVLTLTVVAVAMIAGSSPGLAARPEVGSITSADMVQAVVTDGCGVTATATFANIGRGRYQLEFRFHSQTFDTTISLWGLLARGQTSASETMTVCDAGDTWDRLDVVLYRGRDVVDTESIVKTVVCPPRA